MNDPSYYHWDLFRQPLQTPSFPMGTPMLDIRDDAVRGLQGKAKGFAMDPSCAFWSKEVGLDPGDGMTGVGGRILEIRKEKSRDAARSRRGKENYEFYELAKLLPLPAAITSQLDKASIIRLSISYLKLRDFSLHGDPPWSRDGPPPNKSLKGAARRRNSAAVAMELFELHQGAHILQSLDGFAFSLSSDGRFLYISETVSIYLGLSQVEMSGSSIFEYVHHHDHQELADQLGLGLGSVTSAMSSPSSPASDSPTTPRAITPPISDRVPLMTPGIERGPDRMFCIRMKSTLTKRGVHVRSSGYRVVQIIGHFRHQMSFSMNRKMMTPLLGLVGVAMALPSPTITELRLEADTFIMRLSPEFKVIYCENLISTLTDWKAEDVSGKDLYTFCHAADLHILRKAHIDLLAKGQVLSPSLRLMNKTGGYVWAVLCATALYNSKTSDEQTVLAIFYVISGIEHRTCVMGTIQMANNGQGVSESRQAENQSHQDPDQDDRKPTVAMDDPDPEEKAGNDTVHPGTKLGVSRSSINTLSVSAGTDVSGVGSVNHSPADGNSEVFQSFTAGADVSMEDGDKCSEGFKSSRRKTERPRKRRRDSDEDGFLQQDIDGNSIGLCEDSSLVNHDAARLCKNKMDVSLSLPGSPEQHAAGRRVSPLVPEDLSLRSVVDRRNSSPGPRLSASSSSSPADSSNPSNNRLVNKMISSSVLELEKAMNRHLPSSSKSMAASEVHHCGDEAAAQKHRSTIQWVGAHQTPLPESLSASAFLRHLYANRESVIRSNGRPQFYNGDVPSLNMLTPPGTEGYKDQLHLNIPQIAVLGKAQSSYNATALSMANSTTDSFNMTPPSSVSPQEKVQSPFQDNGLAECGNIIGGSGLENRVHTFSPLLNPSTSDYDPAKPPYISVPSYQCSDTADFQSFVHNNNAAHSGIIAYDSRPHNSAAWYGSAYTS